MTTTKRLLTAAFASLFALLLAMVATLAAPGAVQKAHAAGMGMTLTLQQPTNGDSTIDSKLSTLSAESPQLFGEVTASGKWTTVEGYSYSDFTDGKTYVYTATIKAANGIAEAVLDSDYTYTFNGPQIKITDKSLSTDGKTLTLEGTYLFAPEPTTISNLKVFRNDVNYVELYWDIDDYDNCTGCAVFVDGKLEGKYKKGFGSNTFQTVNIPFGGSHKVYVCAYGVTGNYGKPSNTITITRSLGNSPTPVVTKISANKVSIVWEKASGTKGVYIYANGKKIKASTGKAFVYSAKGAAKKRYCTASYVVSGGKVCLNSKGNSAKALANKRTGTPHSPSYYGWTLKHYLTVAKLSYSKKNSKGKLKATFAVTNTWKYNSSQKIKVKIALKSATGAKIASQTFTVGGVKPWSIKKFSVTFKKAKSGMDLRTSNMNCSISIVR